MKQVSIALIGAGYIGDIHAQALCAVEGAQIQVVCDRREDAAKELARRYGVPETCNIALSLAKREDIDAVLLCVPNKYHEGYARVFLEFGKDVFIEKPMAVSVDEAKQIAIASQDSGRLVMVGHMWRFDVEAQHIREAVQSGRIGQVVKTTGYGIHENWGPAGWFVQSYYAGGGALADMGVHAIDTTRYVLGDPQPKQVYAKIGTFFGKYEVDDTGIVVITWDNGVISVIESGWWHPHAEGPEAASRIVGTKGYASLFPTFLKVRRGKKMREIRPTFPPRTEHCDPAMYARQMAHFVECIRTRKTPVPGIAEGRTVVEIVEAAYASATSGQAVAIEG